MGVIAEVKDSRDYVIGKCLQTALRTNVEVTLKTITLTDYSYRSAKAVINHCTWHAYRKHYTIAKRKMKNGSLLGGYYVVSTALAVKRK